MPVIRYQKIGTGGNCGSDNWIIFRIRRTIFFIGGSSKSKDALFSHSNQFGQFGFCHRTSAETRSVTSAHSAVSHGVRTEINPRLANRANTVRALPPLHPTPETTTDESRTAMRFTPLLFHLADDFHNFLHRFSARSSIPSKVFKGSLQSRTLNLLLPPDKIAN